MCVVVRLLYIHILFIVVVDFFNRINLIYGTVSEYCTEATCPTMSGGSRYEYLWADGDMWVLYDGFCFIYEIVTNTFTVLGIRNLLHCLHKSILSYWWTGLRRRSTMNLFSPFQLVGTFERMHMLDSTKGSELIMPVVWRFRRLVYGYCICRQR